MEALSTASTKQEPQAMSVSTAQKVVDIWSFAIIKVALHSLQ